MPLRKREFTRTPDQIAQSIAIMQEADMPKLVPMTEDDEDYVSLGDREILMLGFVDGDNGVSKHPSDIPIEVLQRQLRICDEGDDMEKHYRNRIRSPLTAIRAFCVLCSVGPKAANKCTCVSCPLWLFRNGKNPFYGKR